jgi:AmmeMemoRadiSam system protein B
MTLDFMPSPSDEHPGLFIRDPYKFSDAMLIIPPPLVECLECFDGAHTDLDLRAALVRATNALDVTELQQHLMETLSAAGFLEDDAFARMRDERRGAFAASPVREPAHAGTAYPADADALRETMQRYMDGAAAATSMDGNLVGIAAPHVSPEGGWQSYRDAYGVLQPEHRERTCVILATSHYGEPERFGLTRKDFVTPLGSARTDTRLVNWLAERAGDAADMEDYCFSFEHTVEFQVVFLQHALGPNVRMLPILCGPFAESLYRGGRPEDSDRVRRFFDALGELNDRESGLLWVLGVDMAHMGARYGDRFRALANEGRMAEVAMRDQRRMQSINAGDAEGFWDQVQQNHDDLKWCGSSPFYTFLKSVPRIRGELLRYEQWNIDEQSVVSFAGMSFSNAPAAKG